MSSSPYEIHNNHYGVRLSFIISDHHRRHKESVKLLAYDAYKKRASRKEGFRLREGKGLGNEALINFEKLNLTEQQALVDRWGEPAKTAKIHQFKDFIEEDPAAITFFGAYRLSDKRSLPNDVILEYTTNAHVLNACHTIITNSAARRKAMGGVRANLWTKLTDCIINLNKKEFPHTLPANPRRLQEKYRLYKKEGYTALIHKGFCNNNSRKVTVDIERLILSLYVQSNKPYVTEVASDYWRFLAGDIDIVDFKTGEIYDRKHFYENGQPITLSEATIWNYINQPSNRAIVDKYRMDSQTYQSVHGPHHHRHAPNYSFSKISMDDRDLPRKTPNGKRVKAYYAYDVASGAIIGFAHSLSKTTELFINCMRNMFHFLDQNSYGMPLQVEVEHHLVNNFKDDLMKAGVVFPFVRWCNAGNSQEKWAETGNRIKKYGFEKRHQDGIGRFYAKLEANRTKSEKIFDADNDNYKEKTYSYEVLVADDLEIIEKYNNALHPNQKKYKDLTRTQVLQMYTNPQMAHIDRPLLMRYIGNSTATTIRRNQYVAVKQAKYALPSPEVMEQLLPNNYEVTAYHLQNEQNEVDCVYLYQNEVFICKCDKIKAYNTANAEWLDQDANHYQEQAKYVSRFNQKIKAGKNELGRLKVMEKTGYEYDTPVAIVQPQVPEPSHIIDFEEAYDNDFNRLNAINSL